MVLTCLCQLDMPDPFRRKYFKILLSPGTLNYVTVERTGRIQAGPVKE
jgi:hypothetical protein